MNLSVSEGERPILHLKINMSTSKRGVRVLMIVYNVYRGSTLIRQVFQNFPQGLKIAGNKSFTKSIELPKNVPKLNVKVYAYLEINVSVSPDNIEEAMVSFKVDKEWLIKNGLKANNVVLMKFSNGRWVQLETSVVSEDSYYVYYEAKTQSFSIYAIATETTEPVLMNERLSIFIPLILK